MSKIIAIGRFVSSLSLVDWKAKRVPTTTRLDTDLLKWCAVHVNTVVNCLQESSAELSGLENVELSWWLKLLDLTSEKIIRDRHQMHRKKHCYKLFA